MDEDAEEGEERKTVPFPPEEFELVLISRRSVYRAGEDITCQVYSCLFFFYVKIM